MPDDTPDTVTLDLPAEERPKWVRLTDPHGVPPDSRISVLGREFYVAEAWRERFATSTWIKTIGGGRHEISDVLFHDGDVEVLR